ncbi:dynamin family protein [Plantactinospora sp. B24E8]|uniref:dynamin family protein n=1 Tax=Plantactinospora sp. B24E8 TaxID=3153567 RepID=UPI00325E57B4
MVAPNWLDVLDEIVRVSGRHGRDDLIQWLRRRRAQLLDPRLRVLVVGEPKQGKSLLINALLNATVCPVGEGISTTIPTVVGHAETPGAALVWSPLPGGSGRSERPGSERPGSERPGPERPGPERSGASRSDGPGRPPSGPGPDPWSAAGHGVEPRPASRRAGPGPAAAPRSPAPSWPETGAGHTGAGQTMAGQTTAGQTTAGQSAARVRQPSPPPGPLGTEVVGPARRIAVPMERIAARISGRGAGIGDGTGAPETAGPPSAGGGRGSDLDGTGPRPGTGVEHAEIGIPRALLASGLVLIDTPGMDVTDPRRPISPAAAPGQADLVLLVSDVTRELSVTELNLLLHIAQSHANVAVVQSKIDMVPHWRAVVERNRQHLADAGVAAALIPVSATLRLQAARTNDKQLNAESHFPELINRLRRDQAGKADTLGRNAVALSSRTVLEQLAAPLRAELAVTSAATRSGPISKLHAAQREVDELRRCSQRWQNTLNDEMADLISDVEYDLRDRTRQILRKVDEAFDTADPLTGWDTFQEWLTENLTEAAEANYAWLAERCGWIAQRVAGAFERYGFDALPSWSVRVPENLADRIQVMEQPTVERFTRTQKLVTGLRGSYGGVLMFGLATTLAGMPLINPISLGAGALFGGKSVRDEGKSLLKRRQAAVKTATQRHVDDFFLRLSKDTKDTARQVQRMLRDHFSELTEDLQEGIVRSFRNAKQAAEVDAAQRDQRQRRIAEEMKRLSDLYERAQALAGVAVVAGDRGGLEPGA